MISATPAGPELIRTSSTGSASLTLSGWPPATSPWTTGEPSRLTVACAPCSANRKRGRARPAGRALRSRGARYRHRLVVCVRFLSWSVRLSRCRSRGRGEMQDHHLDVLVVGRTGVGVSVGLGGPADVVLCGVLGPE